MLKLYDPWDVIEQWQQKKRTAELLYYASDLMESLGFSEDELISTLNRAIHAGASLNISIEENFVHIYRANKNELSSDWKLSSVACYLLTINADPANPKVAKAQMYYAKKNSTHVKIR